MKILLQNTALGLVPLYDSDLDEKRKLKVGQVYQADIKVVRNINFHRKMWAMLNTAWALLPEKTQNGFRSFEGFRAYLLVAAGFYDTYFSPRLKEFVEVPKSMSFASMDDAEFSDCYNAIKDVIWGILSSRVSITQEMFETYLANF